MKGEIIDVAMVKDEFLNISYQVVIAFEEVPDLKLGNVELTQ